MSEVYLKILKPFDKVMFDVHDVYILDLSKSMQFGTLGVEELSDVYKDGRITGGIIENLLASIFKNLIKSPTKNSSFDLFDIKWATSFEVRCITNNGVKTMPSYMIGQGRIYNEEEHLEKLSKINYFIFVDITNSPIFKLITIKSNEHLLFKSMGLKTFYNRFL